MYVNDVFFTKGAIAGLNVGDIVRINDETSHYNGKNALIKNKELVFCLVDNNGCYVYDKKFSSYLMADYVFVADFTFDKENDLIVVTSKDGTVSKFRYYSSIMNVEVRLVNPEDIDNMLFAYDEVKLEERFLEKVGCIMTDSDLLRVAKKPLTFFQKVNNLLTKRNTLQLQHDMFSGLSKSLSQLLVDMNQQKAFIEITGIKDDDFPNESSPKRQLEAL